MARHSGKISKCKFGSNFIDGLRSIEFEQSMGTVDITACGDTGETHATTFESWTGTAEGLLDHEDTAQGAVGIGDELTMEFYTEGDGTGKVYYSGTATIESIKRANGGHSGEATFSYGLKGQGALSGPTTVS